MSHIDKRYMRSIRLLAECYHAFSQLSDTHVRTLGLTPPQFDIIATLGNTEGMSGKELGEKTLMTKGTLTGVLDRLEARGLVARSMNPEDRRCMIVKLTAAGEEMFERIFAPHVEFCRQPLAAYAEKDFLALESELSKLKRHLDSAVPITDSCKDTDPD
jgi:MarR family transcriptional regulator, 2-MHQ and catechol-resistance regulon repressor